MTASSFYTSPIVSIACISFTPTVEPWYVELGMLRF